MPTPLEALEAEVLRLSPAERSWLLDRVVSSLDADADADAALDAAWDREAAERDAEIETGAVVPVDGRAVLARLRAEAE